MKLKEYTVYVAWQCKRHERLFHETFFIVADNAYNAVREAVNRVYFISDLDDHKKYNGRLDIGRLDIAIEKHNRGNPVEINQIQVNKEKPFSVEFLCDPKIKSSNEEK
jgi:hypothetical protein